MSTTLTRWTPTADPFRDRVNRMFDDFLRDLVPARNSEEMSGGRWLPAVDIKESPEALMLTVELPGLKKEEVSITLENQVLTIHGERKFEGRIIAFEVANIERGVQRPKVLLNEEDLPDRSVAASDNTGPGRHRLVVRVGDTR